MSTEASAQPGRLDPRAPRVDRRSGTPALLAAVREFHAAVLDRQDLDLVTRELVRLRSAQVHDCRTCRSVRHVEAADAGVDQAMAEQVARYEDGDLPERARAALRVVDWFISRPEPDQAAVTGPARAELSDLELADLLVSVAKNSTQKVMVALGIDDIDPAVLNEAGVAYYRYREDGTHSGFSPDAATVRRSAGEG